MIKNTLWGYFFKMACGLTLLSAFTTLALLAIGLSGSNGTNINLSAPSLYLAAAITIAVTFLISALITRKVSLFVANTLNDLVSNTEKTQRITIKNKPEEFIQFSDNFNIIRSQLQQSLESNQQISYIIQSMQELLVVVDNNDLVLLSNSAFDNLLKRLDIPAYRVLNDDELFTENKIDYHNSFNTDANHPFFINGSNIEILESEYTAQDKNNGAQKINIKWQRSTLLTESGEFNGFIFTGTDITSVKTINEELRIRNHAIEAASNGVAIIDISNKMRLIYVNPAFEEITGYTYKELVGSNWKILHGEKTSQSAIDIMDESVNLRKSVNLDIINYRKDGSPFWNELSLSPVHNSSGNTTHYLLIQNDVTERIKNQQDLEKAIEKADLANKAKSDFLANMSHEIRTPMNAVLGMSSLCLETSLNKKQKNYVENIHQSGSLLLSIINDILDFSKIEAGKLLLDVIPFSLTDVFGKLELMTQHELKRKGLPLNVYIQETEKILLKGDPLRLGQVLLNLITNSIKFTKKGNIEVSVRQLNRKNNNQLTLEFTVKDTGIGMTQQQAETVFTSFSQADNSITRKYGGSGLGLTICQSFVKMMQGKINITSQPGIGTSVIFTATFGIANKDEISSFSKNTDTKIKINENINNKHILVVEDNLINQQIAKEILIKMGAKVTIANNGLDATKVIQEETFSLILMDLQMPIMDGLTATRYIRKELGMSDLIIIAMTANAMTSDRDQCIEAGMNDYITKPIDISLLKTTLIRWLKKDCTINKNTLPIENKGTNKKDQKPSEIVLDREQALKRLSGDSDLLDTLLAMFLNEHLDDCKKIRGAIDKKDHRHAKNLAHALKGVSGSVGATSVFNHASALDAALNEGHSTQYEILFGKLEVAMRTLIQQLQNEIN